MYKRRNSFYKWYYMLFVQRFAEVFHQSRKQLVFFQNILRSTARDQWVQAKKKLLCLVIVKNYFYGVLCSVWSLSKARGDAKSKNRQPSADFTVATCCGSTVSSSHPRCSIKKSVLKNFAILTGSTCVGCLFKRIAGLRH